MTRPTSFPASSPAVVVGLLLALSACGDGRSDYDKALDEIHDDAAADLRRAAQANFDRQIRAENAWEASRGPATSGLDVCKVAVGIVMERSPRAIAGSAIDANTLAVSYRREDGTRWAYRCEVTKSRVRWSTVEGGRQGPWRDDEDFRFIVNGGVLTVTSRNMGDGSDIVTRYKLATLTEVVSR